MKKPACQKCGEGLLTGRGELFLRVDGVPLWLCRRCALPIVRYLKEEKLIRGVGGGLQ